MNKILSGLLGSFLVLAVVTGSAYAVFADTATVSNLSITSGNADLKINGQDSLNLSSPLASNVYPGWEDGVVFTLSNSSTSNIGLDISAKLDSATGGWGVLSPVMNAAVIEYDSQDDATADLSDHIPGNGAGIINSTGWQTLSTWNSAPISITKSPINQGDTHYFVLWGMIPSTADNSVASQTLTTNWTVTGTQH